MCADGVPGNVVVAARIVAVASSLGSHLFLDGEDARLELGVVLGGPLLPDLAPQALVLHLELPQLEVQPGGGGVG